MGVKRIKELADSIAEKHGVSKSQAQEMVKDLFEDIKQSVGSGNKVAISNFVR